MIATGVIGVPEGWLLNLDQWWLAGTQWYSATASSPDDLGGNIEWQERETFRTSGPCLSVEGAIAKLNASLRQLRNLS